MVNSIDESICEITGVKVENHTTDEDAYFKARKTYLVPSTPGKIKTMIGNGNVVEFDFDKGVEK
ncbi:hypothetical protein [Francisella philomiragia]|uniref:hypothetical protein n=1 Tax=Francisella philomiragia TaxID=28110 RepID=UPI001C9DAB7D|nr:hypothetical protein [Francisella philomiragia]MBY7733470.1 hypothetical protein [Francisella philomiragia]